MVEIEWCKHQKNGIELIEPNNNLARAYMKKAEDSLNASINLINNKDWRISTLYYSMYFGVYAILMRIGIKCEIHACTIALVENVLDKYFTKDEINLLKDCMKSRIDMQYYTNRNIPDSLYNKIVKEAPLFLINCKNILVKLAEKDIIAIREKLK